MVSMEEKPISAFMPSHTGLHDVNVIRENQQSFVIKQWFNHSC